MFTTFNKSHPDADFECEVEDQCKKEFEHQDHLKLAMLADKASQHALQSGLYNACKYGHYFMALLLLNKGANADDPSGMPLKQAALEGHTRLVELLLERGAKVDPVTMHGAKIGNNQAIISMLESQPEVELRL